MFDTYQAMARIVTALLALIAAAVFIGDGRVIAQVPTPTIKSVRPADVKRIRTSVTRLLGWGVGIQGNAFRQLTFSEAAGLADALGLGNIEGFSDQQVSPTIAKNLDYRLSPDEVAVVRNRLAELRMKMATYRTTSFGSDEASRRRLFEFSTSLQVGTIVGPFEPASLASIDRLATEFGINVAIESPEDILVVRQAIDVYSPRVGLSADVGQWIEQGIRPLEGLSLVKHRLMVVRLSDRSALGPTGMNVTLGEGIGGFQQFLMELVRYTPEPRLKFEKCVNCYRGIEGVTPLFVTITKKVYDGGEQTLQADSAQTFGQLSESIEAFEKAARPAMGYRVNQLARHVPPTFDGVTSDERQKIETATPKRAAATPKKLRKLLVIDLCPAGDFHHQTIAHTNLALQLMAKNTGAFEPIFSNDLNNLKYPNITQFDGVFLNSTVGEIFADPDVMGGLLRFVREGGGVAGMHAATYGSQNLPEYGELMGGVDGPHRVEAATIKIEDLTSPLTRGFGGQESFHYTDEYYHFLPTGPYSRNTLRVLIRLDTEKSDMSRWNIRPDRDYALAWIKSYGNGRVFNNAMGHLPTYFATPAFSELVLSGIQFVLGDLEADTTPSAYLSTRGRLN